ncbi:DUF3530 family protein [Neptuniibacter sp. CAU 1671]|uniref:DUF3530 family protein n=1 Tax=Neptuniibacter sp. CAU 1671 TaxID=3032593 RepID=UPI0023DA78EF|nr:DUF3530 family protein [Neptuniibacter sp. CAU 1671]MDF2181440.1 DUF3530 family protein [Neptuniibacter sp. CAU 1671]
MPLRSNLLACCTLLITLVLSTPMHAAETASGAAASTAEIPERTQPDPEAALKQLLLETRLPGNELLQLDTPSGGLIGFLHRAEQKKPLGSVLILPDQSTHPDWPEHTRTLREGLAQQGWNTLAIYLPIPPAAKLPKRTLPVLTALGSGAETSASGATESVATEPSEPSTTTEENQAEAYLKQTRDLMTAALNHLKSLDDSRILVVGIGKSGQTAVDGVIQFQEGFDLRLILLDVEQSSVPDLPGLLQQLPRVKTTVIDLFHPTTLLAPYALATPAQRAVTAKREGLSNYHQRELPAFVSTEASDPRLLKHLRGAIERWIVQPEKLQAPKPAPTAPTKKKQTPPGATAVNS